MATKPTPGGSDGTYGTELNEFLDIGHDSDGTHTKSQMLTDMEWSPTTESDAVRSAGGTTFPNGYILHRALSAEIAANTTSGTIDLSSIFTVIYNPQITPTPSDNGSTTTDLHGNVGQVNAQNFKITNTSAIACKFYYFVVGR